MDHPFRWLPYLLRFQSSVGPQEITGEDADCTSPVVFPDDKDEPIQIVFSCSHNEFTQMLSSLIIGGQIAYPDTFVNVMHMFMRNWECDMDICERIASCLTDENPAVVAALAELMRSNPTIQQAISEAISENGGGIPGQPLSDEQQQRDLLPPEVKPDDECDYDALWGACLYLVQSGNRAITDFFENLEAASNTLEAATIIAGAIPAAGQYAEAAGEFADQMQENIAEGYAAAYTETYEEELACALFCLARSNSCELPLDGMVAILADRLSVPGLVVDFGLLMNFVSAGTWVGADIANVAYLVYFNALKYGQQFGDIIGVRPLSDLMGLGADQLASDNWMTLCDCPDDWQWTFPLDDVFTGNFEAVLFDNALAEITDETISAVDDPGSSPATMYAQWQTVVDGHVTRIDSKFRADTTVPGDFEYRLYIDDVLVEAEIFSGDGEYMLQWSGDETGSHTYRWLTGVVGTAAGGDGIVTHEIKLYGQDTNPFTP